MIFKNQKSHHRPIPEFPTPIIKNSKIFSLKSLKKYHQFGPYDQKNQNVEKEQFFCHPRLLL